MTVKQHVVNFMIVLAGVLFAVIANDASVTRKDLGLGVCVVFVGLLCFNCLCLN